jgi:hypothetical protein
MAGFTFISCVGEDRTRVNALIEAVPKGLFRIYTHDFVDGATLLTEMARHVQGCSAFFFLASRASLASVWCKHEIALAQVEAVTRGVKIVALALEPGIAISDLPQWMRGFWMPIASSRSPVLRRRFVDLIEECGAPPQYFGLHTRVDRVKQLYYERISLDFS